MNLLNKIRKLEKSSLKKVVDTRLNQFKSKKTNDSWFSEMCFCILTSNSKAITAIAIQNELGAKGFKTKTQKQISSCIRRNKHRFHNNKSKFILAARPHIKIRDIILKEEDPREWLFANIKGLGWKESSHFLRNVGYENYAILDRHILNLMLETSMIKERPKSLTEKHYKDIESKFQILANKLNMTSAELDLYMWFIKTGVVLK